MIFGLLLFVAGVLLYFLPTIVATSRNVRSSTGIIIVNILLGWTVAGWLVSLVWAFAAETTAQAMLREAALARMAYGHPQQPQYPLVDMPYQAIPPSSSYSTGRAVGNLIGHVRHEDDPPISILPKD